jgi:hypothetical protein
MIHNEVFFAAGYAVVLALAGRGFEWMADQREREAIDSGSTSIGCEQKEALRQNDPSVAHLEAARFQRGLALVVSFCAIYILFIVALRNPGWSSVGLLCTAACGPGWISFRIGRRLMTSFFEGSNRLTGRCPSLDFHERENNDRPNSNPA